MSMRDYEAAVALLSQLPPGSVRAKGWRPPELIVAAERALGLAFPSTYRRFLQEFGYLAVRGAEFYGLVGDDFDRAGVPDAIWLTRDLRRRLPFPDTLVAVCDLGDGEVGCVDTSRRNAEAESPVLAFRRGEPLDQQRWEVLAPDFGAFLLRELQDALER